MIYAHQKCRNSSLILLCAQAAPPVSSGYSGFQRRISRRITPSFIGEPEYALSQDAVNAQALDIRQTGVIQGLPLQFSGNNLVKTIRAERRKMRNLYGCFVDLTRKMVKPGGGEAAKTAATIRSFSPLMPINAATAARRRETG